MGLQAGQRRRDLLDYQQSSVHHYEMLEHETAAQKWPVGVARLQ